MKRIKDFINIRQLQATVVASASQAAAAGVDLGDNHPQAPAMVRVVCDAVAGAGSLAAASSLVEGSNDGTTWSNAIDTSSETSFAAIAAAGAAHYSVKPFRHYRRGATTLTGTSVTYRLELIFRASRRPVTQAL